MAGVTNWYPGVFGYENHLKKQELPFKSAIKPKDARNRIEGELPQEPEEPQELDRPDPQKAIEGRNKPALPPGRKQIADKPFTGPHAPDTPGKTAIESGPSEPAALPPGTSKTRGPHAPEYPPKPAIEGRPSRTDRQRVLPGPERANNGGDIQVEQLPINRDQPNRPALPPGRLELTSTAGHLQDDHSQALEQVTQDNAEDRNQGPLEMSRPKAIERRKLIDARCLDSVRNASPWHYQYPGSKTGRISEGHVNNLVQNQERRRAWGGYSDVATREERNLYYPKGEHEPKFPTRPPLGE